MVIDIAAIDDGAIIACACMLLLASITDIKKKEVPDWLSIGGIAAGLGMTLIRSLVGWNAWFFLYSLFGVGIGAAIGFGLFYSRQWGGGDAKLLMAVGAFLGFELSSNSRLISFILLLGAVGCVYGACWSVFLAVKHRKRFAKHWKSLLGGGAFRLLRTAFICAGCFGAVLSLLFLEDALLKSGLAAMFMLCAMLPYLWAFAKAVELSAMFKRISPTKLGEGDWIAQDIVWRGRKICSRFDYGLTKKQLSILLRMYRLGKLKRILIKEGFPFVPAFLIAFILNIFFGKALLNFLISLLA